MNALAQKGEAPSDSGSLPPTLPPLAPETAGGAYAGRYAAGTIVAGKYQLVSVLGEGGMGSVWLARNRTLEVDVALKLMRAELAENVDGIAERMLQEARAAASIGHPGIIQVFDFGFSELGDPFIVMELLRGESLAELILRRGRLSPLRAAQILLPIADALAAAHGAGIVHRDMKPENVFLSRLGDKRLQPKVLDFGIAKLEQRAQDRLTRDGAVIGSPAYMAPEQLRGEPDVDARVDVWALTVVLYQLLVGRRPFDGDSYHASMWNIVNAEPRALVEQGVDEPELCAIVQRGLAKDRERRFASVRELGRELASWLLARGVQDDICDAPLKGWLESSAPVPYSFFPAEDSALREAEQAPVAAPGPARDLVETSGTRRIAQDSLAAQPTTSDSRLAATALRSRASTPLLLRRRWLSLTLAAAASAFVGAAVFASWPEDAESGELDEPVRPPPRRSSQTSAAPKRAIEPAPEPVRERLPRPSPPDAELAEASRTSANERDESSREVTPAPRPVPRRAAPQRAPQRRTLQSELKNPFR